MPTSRKTGLPKALEPEEGEPQGDPLDQATPEEFARQMFGTADVPKNDLGMPSLEWLKSQFRTKSACIRYLLNQQFKVKDIAKHMDVRYQHVRNVSKQELKRTSDINTSVTYPNRN